MTIENDKLGWALQLYTWKYLEDALDSALVPDGNPCKRNERKCLESDAKAISVLAALVPSGRDIVARQVELYSQAHEGCDRHGRFMERVGDILSDLPSAG